MNAYKITIAHRGSTSTDHIVEAMSAADAITIAETNLCCCYDVNGKCIDRVIHIEACIETYESVNRSTGIKTLRWKGPL